MLKKEIELLGYTLISKIYNFLAKNSISLPDRTNLLSVEVFSNDRGTDLPYTVEIHEEREGTFCRVKDFSSEEEAYEWLKDGKKSTRVINKKLKEAIAIRVAQVYSEQDLSCFPEKDTEFLAKVKKDVDLFESIIKDLDKGVPDVTIDTMFGPLIRKAYTKTILFASTGNTYGYYEDWVEAGRPSLEALEALWEAPVEEFTPKVSDGITKGTMTLPELYIEPIEVLEGIVEEELDPIEIVLARFKDTDQYILLSEEETDSVFDYGWEVGEWYNENHDIVTMYVDLETGEFDIDGFTYIVKFSKKDVDAFDEVIGSVYCYFHQNKLKDKGINTFELLSPIGDCDGCESVGSWILSGRKELDAILGDAHPYLSIVLPEPTHLLGLKK